MERFRLVCIFALAAAVSACGSSGNGNDGGNGNDAGDGAVDLGEDNCLNTADDAVYTDLGEGDMALECGRERVSDNARACVLGACGEEVAAVLAANNAANRQALADCVIDCTRDGLGATPGAALTSMCLACYGQTVSCGSSFCASECQADPSAQICTDCLDANGCSAGFDVCSGITDEAPDGGSFCPE